MGGASVKVELWVLEQMANAFPSLLHLDLSKATLLGPVEEAECEEILDEDARA